MVVCVLNSCFLHTFAFAILSRGLAQNVLFHSNEFITPLQTDERTSATVFYRLLFRTKYRYVKGGCCCSTTTTTNNNKIIVIIANWPYCLLTTDVVRAVPALPLARPTTTLNLTLPKSTLLVFSFSINFIHITSS